MKVFAVRRYPVKSMGGESLGRVFGAERVLGVDQEAVERAVVACGHGRIPESTDR